jgi:uncharacterized protein (DUF433 family)
MTLSAGGIVAFTVQAEAPRLREDENGAMRIGESRVLLELVLRAFQDGATPEAIVQRYATIELSDVYDVIAYYLRHRSEVGDYLARREREAADIQRQIQQQTGDLSDIRARLQARRTT